MTAYFLGDYSIISKYVHNDFYFKDGTFLTVRGADEFTREFVKEIK